MKKHSHLFLLILTVFLAGCVGQPPAPAAGTAGVIIKSFSVDLKETEPGVPVILSLLVKNVGAKQATSISTELIGLTSEWTISPDRTQTISDLSPPDPDRGITEGQEDFKTWTLTGPSKNTKLSYDANARVYYTYETVSETLFRVVTYDYFRQTNDRGGVQTSKTTGGPLSVTFKAPNTVISANEVSIQFEIQNSGGGRAYKSDTKPTTANLDIVSVSVSGTKDCTTSRDVRLIDGRTGRLYCKVSTFGVSNFEDKTVMATIKYRYYVESSTSITVLPSVEGVIPGVPGVPPIPLPPGEGTWLFKYFLTQDERDVGATGKYRIEYISASSSQHRFRIKNMNNNNECDVVLEPSKEESIKVEKEAATEFCKNGVELSLTAQVKDLSVTAVKCSNCFQVFLTAEDSQGKQTTFNLALLPTVADFNKYKIELTDCTKPSWTTAKMTVSNPSATKSIELKQGEQATVAGILTEGIFVNVRELTGKGSEDIWKQIPTVAGELCRARIVSQIGTPIV